MMHARHPPTPFLNMTNLDRQLEKAVGDGDLAAVQRLVAQGADLNAITDDGTAMLTQATKYTHSLDYIRELLALGTRADVPASIGETPLVHAVWENNYLLVKLLLGAGANPNTVAFQEEAPMTALDAAHDEHNIQDTKADSLNLEAIIELLKHRGGKRFRDLS